ncbi:MAG: DUF2267 domain-containing protein [Labilithrix sp.]|nr:DUF2267 domain-containing protein [Labilithrix sp.]
MGALVARMSPELAERVRRSLPPALAAHVHGPRFGGALDVAELYAHVGELEDVAPETAQLHARAVCGALARSLPRAVLAALRRELGPEIAATFG